MASREKIKNCNHTKDNYLSYLVTPLETGIKNFNKIVNYYEYCAPQIDCIHSEGKIEDVEVQKEVFLKLVKIAKMQNNYNFVQRLQPNSFGLYHLEGFEICIKCPRMVCKIGKDETELSALLRHIRNSLSHGKTYVKKTRNQTYIVLEDYSKDKKPKLTGKMVLTKAILEKWKELLEDEMRI